MDEESPERLEYWDGYIVNLSDLRDMAGGTPEHGFIASNFLTALNVRLRGSPCRVTGPDQRIKVPNSPLYYYPDVTVICGQLQLDTSPGGQITVLNPRVVVEVLSPSTERYDRGKKMQRYFQIPTMEEYLLAAQSEPRVESFLRQTDGSWRFSFAEGLDAKIELKSISLEIPLIEIYSNIEFPPAEEGIPRTE